MNFASIRPTWLGLFATAALGLSQATAGTITLVILAPDDAVFQQTAASPCVIGGENCLNGDFPYTVAGAGGGGAEFVETSPLYTLDQVLGVTMATNFTVALDYNDSAEPQILRLFEVTYYSGADGSGEIGTEAYTGPTELKTNNNGVGFSDFLLEGFMIPDGTQSLQFQAEWFNNSGADRYFLIGGDQGPAPIPEPSTVLLLGVGLCALGFRRRNAGRA